MEVPNPLGFLPPGILSVSGSLRIGWAHTAPGPDASAAMVTMITS